MAKYAAAEAALAALDAAIQVHGGNGLSTEYGLCRLGAGAAAADRPGQPRDDPQLRRPARPGPAAVLLSAARGSAPEIPSAVSSSSPRP